MKANKSSGIEFLFGMTALLIFQLLGEVSVRLLDLPVPGPVAGLLYLLVLLLAMGKFKRPAPESLEQSSLALLNHLSLLFVPAGVGVMVHFQRLEEEWLPITVALFLGVLITMGTTALSMQFLMRFFDKKAKKSS
ncbi:CidA/LrgA family protein [Cocleimonas flava]|uniref:Holin-like protein n=1 Tax=Cocleimonas flava TaxID=634765 RepID=A0A4R1ESX6_9GAMM|nr:CidA/LrgA family protein [Cocleimonas flava]TCJ82809.1 holin-like protein [Cocleimonas flava]